MVSLNDLFAEYLKRIEPPSVAVKRAQSAHQPLRDDLAKDDIYGPFIEKTLLSGSYGRDTAIFFIKDVDVIIQTTFTQSSLQEKKRQGENEQECLLRLTQEAIKRTGRDARTRKARRSIHVTLPEEINDLGENIPELTMDIVPVLLQTKCDQDPMKIADRELIQWCDTYPISQLGDSENRNENAKLISGRHSYKPLVKVFKAWKSVHFRTAKTPKGFILECMTAKYHNPDATQWIYAIRDLWQNICTDYPDSDNILSIPEVPDISDTSPFLIPIAKTVEEAQGVLKKIHSHLALLEQALEEANYDLDKSAKTLRRIFGQDCEELCFPMPSDIDDPDDGGSSKRGPNPLISPSNKDIREAPEFG